MSADDPIGCVMSRWTGEKHRFFPGPFIRKAHFHELKSPGF